MDVIPMLSNCIINILIEYINEFIILIACLHDYYSYTYIIIILYAQKHCTGINNTQNTF